MELELQQQELHHYEPLLNTTALREETMEMIVPDALPDILTVLDTSAVVLLNRRECAAGSVTVTGAIRCDVLYRPERGDGMQSMTAEVPYQLVINDERVAANANLMAAVRLTSADTRVLNPRKILIRCEILADVSVFIRKNMCWCCEIPQRECYGIQQKTETWDGSFVRQVAQRPFPFSDTLSLPGSKPGVETILRTCVDLCVNEEKLMGSKLVFKGSVMVRMLYRSTEGRLVSVSFDLPFSQMIEGENVSEAVSAQLHLALQSCEVSVDDDEGRNLMLELEILAQAVLWEKREIAMVSDAYSVRCQAVPELSAYELSHLRTVSERRYSLRETMDSPTHVEEVLSVTLLPGQLRLSRQENAMEVAGDIHISVVSEDAQGETAVVNQTVPFAMELDAPPSSSVQVTFVRDETAATVTAGGLEVRSELLFQIVVTTYETVHGVSALQVDAEKTVDFTGRPSIVLRQLRDGETMWDIAKAYCTTCTEIERANELKNGETASNRMLLIPRKR